jgi:hypothetical protein
MYRSPSYASQGTKSAFVEISGRSADAARLPQHAQEMQAAQPPNQTRSLARRAASRSVELLDRLGRMVALRRGEARGPVPLPG